jgi:hypothetical protein
MASTGIFLLSPAHCGGKRAATLARPAASFDLAIRLRSSEGAPLGEVFSFMSGLYFRGKLTYARAFAAPPPAMPGAWVITSGRGLMLPEAHIDLADVARFAGIAVDAAESRYLRPLRNDLIRLHSALPEDCRIVLLGSIATNKYVEALLEVFGGRLCFPEPFIGRGDMSRGALMLRAASEGAELPYVLAAGAVRSLARGRRSPLS